MGKLANALRAKYGDNPRRALRALGIDQSLLDPNDHDDDNESERMRLRHRGMSQRDVQRDRTSCQVRSERRQRR